MKTLYKNTDKQRLTIVNAKSDTNLPPNGSNDSLFSLNEKIDAVYFIMMLEKKNSISRYNCGLIPQNS